MCGIAGFVQGQGGAADELAAMGRRMADALLHRGPDDGGVWTDAQAGACLAHRRLAILDLSPAGAQPMASACGRWVIAYNGEVFNHRELRAELGGSFRGGSDTEVIVEACARWGVEATCRKLIGMFAFALWDRAERRLWLVRDRMGIKPLYWRLSGGVLSFGSELKALQRHPGWAAEVDREALASYLRFGCVPAPRSIWRGVGKLPPGHILSWSPGAEPRLAPFWDLAEEAAAAEPLDLPDDEAADRLEALLTDAVGRRMVADVPLGAFLSGGVDSSTVVALMQKQSARPVKTFCMGFAEAAYDEAPHARAVAAHLGTDHTELVVRPEDARAVIPDLPRWWDEPFADSSQIPTLLVSRLARTQVTVALSGDGGDELFAGYSRHLAAARLWPRLAKVPAPLRKGVAGLLSALPPARWDGLAGLLPRGLRPSHPGERLHKLAAALSAKDLPAFHRRLMSQWPAPESLVVGVREPASALDDPRLAGLAPVERMQLADMMLYLPDDILAKVDRASMAVSLEARVPLLDHRLVRFALTLPGHQKIRDGKGKWLLRQVLHRHVPAELIERPKQGFGVPIGQWLRGPLRDWAEALISDERLRAEGLVEAGPVRRAWAEHLSGAANRQHALWTVLMLQSWLEEQRRETVR